MIRTKLTIQGEEVIDYQRLEVVRSMGDFNATSNFVVTIDTPFGRHSGDFTIGNEVLIFCGQGCRAHHKNIFGCS